MNPLQPPYPSIALVLSQDPCPMRLPAYRAAHQRRYHPYPRFRTSRTLDFDDPFMRTVDTRYDGPRLDGLQPTVQEEEVDVDIEDTVANLSNAISSKGREDRVRRLSLSTLVIDLAFAVQDRLEWLNAMRK